MPGCMVPADIRWWTDNHFAHAPPNQALSVLKNQVLMPVHQVCFGAMQARGPRAKGLCLRHQTGTSPPPKIPHSALLDQNLFDLISRHVCVLN